LNLLLDIAEADGEITKPEITYLKKVSQIFGFSNDDFERIVSYQTEGLTDPYKVLGVSQDTSFNEIKKKWKNLVINHHPDLLISQGMPEELVKKSLQRIKEVNNAWDIIKNKKMF
jgi:DnaJ like chaperone protein